MHAMRQLIGRAMPTPAEVTDAARPRPATALGGEAGEGMDPPPGS